MEEKLRLSQAVLVEGKYDKIKLESLLNALILPVDGFRIYRDRQLRALIRFLAGSCGVVILTDSDSAGFRIRNYIATLAQKGKVTHVYIPDLIGKERRKRHASKEGKLGVEGVEKEILREALSRAGLAEAPGGSAGEITKLDLYESGLSGKTNSRLLRQALLDRLGLPELLSQNSLLPVLNHMLSREEFFALAGEIAQLGNRM